ncbi:MAG: (Fe-S)-binding protein [Acidobacteria bacterium]|nr:(Fe-S)-binding protein [Acidobacteriota bacterium]
MSAISDFAAKAENLDCIHCGLCLSSCPTYTQLWREADSPRGRIYLINALRQGRIGIDRTFQEHIDLCLGCRSCESACPSGVQFERLLIEARAKMEKVMPRGGLQSLLRRVGFHYLLPYPGRLHAFFRFTRHMQKLPVTKMRKLVTPSSFIGRSLELLEDLPWIDPRSFILIGSFAALAPRRRAVAFFRGCVMNEVYFPAQLATLHVLRTAGCDIEVIREQTCCGALHEHNGYRVHARELAWQNIQGFKKLPHVPIISNSGGCGAFLKHYDSLFDVTDPRRKEAEAFSARIRDFSQFLIDLQWELPLAPLDMRITYHDPCHLIHGQGISQQPRLLLQQIPGIQYVELRRASSCCGNAGTYSLTEPGMSARVLHDKIENIAATGAQAVITANPGCMLQIQSGLRKAGLDIQVLHLAEFLSRSLRGSTHKR